MQPMRTTIPTGGGAADRRRRAEADAALDAIATLAARRFDAPLALVLRVDDAGLRVIGGHGRRTGDLADPHPFWTGAIGADRARVVLDGRGDPELTARPLVVAGVAVGFCAAAPLVAADGRRVGLVFVADDRPRSRAPAGAGEDLEGLATVAIRHVEAVDAARRADRGDGPIPGEAGGGRPRADHLELVADNLPFLVSYVDRDLRHLFVNRTGAAWFDSRAEDVVGTRVATIVGAATFERLRPHFERALRGAETSFEVQVDCPDGTRRDLEATCVPDRDPSGVVRGFVNIVADVTDRRRVDAEVRRKTRELELIFNHVPVLIFHKDDRNRILRLNEPAARSIGRTIAEVEGGDTRDFFPDLAAKYHADDLAVITTGEPRLGIVEPYAPLGRPQSWVRTDKVPVTDPTTGERFLFVVASDITAEKLAEDSLRASEARYRRLYNETPIMQQSVDTDGRLVQVSDHWLEKLGYRRDEVIGRSAVDFLAPASRLRAESDAGWKLRRHGALKDVEYQMVRKDGGVVDVLLSAVVERDSTGAVTRSMEVMTDITDRKVIERQFAQAQKMETIGKLTGGLAHDFNNLLGVVLGNLQLVQRSIGGDERTGRRVKAAIDAVARGAELTRRLLAYSRLQRLETESVDTNPLIVEMAAILRRTVGETIVLDLRLDDGLPPIETDPNQLQSALLNLVINARDAMPAGGRVTIRSALAAGRAEADEADSVAAGPYVAISVADTGEGIPAAHLDRIFEPFFTTKDVGKGSGLGLSMVYGFMKQSGGHVAVASTVGVGTVVTMRLPVALASPRPAADPPAATTAAAVGECVLVVEDQAEVREVAVGLVEDLGYRTLVAADAAGALAIVESGAAIDLVFTDIVMPGGILGTDLARRIAERRPEVPCVFATGYAEAELLAEGAAQRRTHLLFKPYGRSDLAETFRAALDAARPAARRPNPEPVS